MSQPAETIAPDVIEPSATVVMDEGTTTDPDRAPDVEPARSDAASKAHAEALAALAEMRAEDEAEGEVEAKDVEPQAGDDGEPEPEPAAEPEPKPEDAEAEMTRHQRLLARKAERERRRASKMLARIEAEKAELAKWRSEQERWDREAKVDPLGATARRLGVRPEELLASYVDEQAQAIPDPVRDQIESLRSEIEKMRTDRAEAERKAQEMARQQGREHAIRDDVQIIAGIAVKDEMAKRYPHYASLPESVRLEQAEQMERYVLATATPEQRQKITHLDIIEALDERAKTLYSSLTNSRWLRGEPEQQKAAKQSRKRRAPTASDAAAPAQKRGPETAQERRAAAVAALRALKREHRE